MSTQGGLKERYSRMAQKVEAQKLTDRVMMVMVLALAAPFVFFYWIDPYQSSALAKARLALSTETTRYNMVLAAEEEKARRQAEMARGATEIGKIDALVLEPRLAFQFIDSISHYAAKNGLKINFIKKTPHESYSKTYSPPADGSGQVDEEAKFSYRVLPIEIIFRSTAADMTAFFGMLEGFGRVNFLTKKITVTRTDDGECEVGLVLEILIELNLT